jgi:hypothetical protein
MTDTPPEIQRMVRERIMARSAEERFVMGAQMFDAALAMVRASFPSDLSETEGRLRLFERLYGTPPPWSHPNPRPIELTSAGC